MAAKVSPAVLLALLVAVGLSASCTNTPSTTPLPSVCDGVSSDIGGCTAERHPFVGASCEELAKEFGGVLDRQVVALLNAPTDPSQAMSVRLKQTVVILTTDMNTKLRELGLAETCDVPAFLAVAEPEFSADLRAKVGSALFDGEPAATYDDWLADVTRTLAVIDAGE
jgi:hypothetical protein